MVVNDEDTRMERTTAAGRRRGSRPHPDRHARAPAPRPARRSTSEVAEILGVTRQTVYRYFRSTEELLNAAAMDAVTELESQLVEHVAQHSGRRWRCGRRRRRGRGLRLRAPARRPGTQPPDRPRTDQQHGRRTDRPHLDRTGPLAAVGLPCRLGGDRARGELQRELVEHLLRTLQSLVLDPGDPERSGAELRAYLQRWVAPAVPRRAAAAATRLHPGDRVEAAAGRAPPPSVATNLSFPGAGLGRPVGSAAEESRRGHTAKDDHHV